MSLLHLPTEEKENEEEIEEILTRLPAKSLMRFKSVSKLWSSLICSQYFTKRFQRLSSSSPRLYMNLSFFDNSHLKDALLSASPRSDSGNTISSFEADQDLTIPAMRGYYHVSQVFHGLMCLMNEKSAKIYNTTTRQLVVLPDMEESSIIPEDHKYKKIMYHICHDPVHDQNKVVCTVSKTREKSYRGGDVSRRGWRKVPCQCPLHMTLTQGLTINGCLYSLAWIHLPDSVLVSFDVSSEEISVHQVPKDAEWPHGDLIEYGEKLAILEFSRLQREGKTKLWVMEDAMKNRCSKKTMDLHPSQLNLLKMHIGDNMSLRVQGTTRKGEVILVPRVKSKTDYRPGVVMMEPQIRAFFYIFLYDLQKNDMRKVEIKETPNRYLTNTCDIAGFDGVENLMYL
ncbi:hypothetical protein Bca52824_011649 [Brassica carinata]|uniref:F-box domain-containing protein n=1 Tax=Brassica carinata TaxID=52824 RepID=A0A8X7VVG8_BRACI|nr:hypothetical protein Bca52824_011649 [Brassica carinata]